jgi:hypothetical protein
MQKILLFFVVALCFAKGANATCPLLDTVEYEGKVFALAHWTNAPVNGKVNEWRRALPHCSAMGQGRAVYRIENGEIFLTMFRGCSATLSVSEAYSQPEPKILATWLSGRLDVARGPCTGGWDHAKEYFRVREGRLLEFVQSP